VRRVFCLEGIADGNTNIKPCPKSPDLFWVLFLAGVIVMAYGVVNEVLTSKQFKRYEEHGVEVQARCITAWTTKKTYNSSEGGTTTTVTHHNTLVYCVQLPGDATRYIKVTKEFTSTPVDPSLAAPPLQVGALTTVNHLLSATGDARNAVHHYTDAMRKGNEYRFRDGLLVCLGGCGALQMLSMVFLMGCGGAMQLVTSLSFFCVVPGLMWIGCSKKVDYDLKNPDGTVEQVDEQAMQMAVRGPMPQIPQMMSASDEEGGGHRVMNPAVSVDLGSDSDDDDDDDVEIIHVDLEQFKRYDLDM